MHSTALSTLRPFLFLLVLFPWLAAGQAVQFAATFGGSGSDTVFAVRHHEGFSYVAGRTTSADFPVTDGSTYRGDPGETGDIFVAKLNAQGQIVAATLLGGSGPDFANGLAITDGPGVPDGNGGETFPKVITISGWTGSTDFRTLNPIQAANGGKTDAVIAQFDLNLNLLFSTYLGGAEDDQFSGLTPIVNNVGDDDLMFFGFTTSTDFPFPTPNAADPTTTVKNLTTNADGLLVRMNRNRTVPMASLLRRTSSGNGTQNEVILAGTSGMTFPATLADRVPQYAVYVTGWTDGDFFRHSSDPTGSGKRIFLTEINPNSGFRTYSRVLGGSGDDIGQAVAITARGVVVMGQTTSTDLPHTKPLFQSGPGGGTDAVLVLWQHRDGRIPLFAVPPFVAYLGGSGEDSGRALAPAFGPNFPQSSLAEHVHFSGVTGSADLPLLPTPQQPPAQATYGGGATDGFFGRLAVGPGLVLEAKNLTFDGGTDDDAFTSVAAVQDDGTDFEGVAGGAVQVVVAEARGQIQRAMTKRDRARVTEYSGRGKPPDKLPDLTVLLVPREPLKVNVEEMVTLVITNKGSANATEIDVEIVTDDVAGAPTGEVIRVEYAGSVLEFDDDDEVFFLPSDVVLPPGQSLELKVTVTSLPAAGLGVPPGVGLFFDVFEKEEDAVAADNGGRFILPVVLAPDLAVELVSATQDPPGVTSPQARYELRVRNVGTAAAETAEVVLTGLNLKNATYQLAGGAVIAMGDLDGPGEKRVPVGPLAPGDKKPLVVQGEPARPTEVTRLAGRGVAAGDENPENNTSPPGETTPGPGPDYAVSIVSQTIRFEDRDNATILTLRTIANLTLTLPEGLPVERVADAVLTTRHVGANGLVTADPGNLGSCERPDAQTTVCTFPAEAFFQAGKPPGLIRLEVREDMDIVLPPEGPKVTFSVVGDGQDPTKPNNFAEPDLAQKGAVTVTRTSLSAHTVLIRPGLVGNLVTQRLRVHNAGPGTVKDLKLNIFSRLRFPLPEPAYLGFIQPPQVVAGAAAGVTVTVTDGTDEIAIASLAPGGEVVLEFVDVRELMGDGTVILQAPAGSNLLVGEAVIARETRLGFVITPLVNGGKAVDMAIAMTAQRIENIIRDGRRVTQRVTEFEVRHRGDGFGGTGPTVADVVLMLRGSGVNLGSGLEQRFDSGGITDLLVAGLGVTRPEAPANPNVLRVPLGSFQSQQTNRYVLRDDVAAPDQDGLLGLSGEVNHPLFDPILFNNVFSRDLEYQAFLSTLDYAVFIRDQTVTTFLDPNFSVPRPVFALRTRFECSISGSQGAELPRMILNLSLGGHLLEARLVPKGPDIPPAPVAALQVQQDHPLSHQLTAEFPAALSRDYFVETVSPAPAPPYLTVADLTGDGEIPAAGNNNRATRTVEDDLQTFADVVVTGSPLDLENPLLRFKEQVTTVFLVSNRSRNIAARNVRLNLGERIRSPLGAELRGLVRTVRVLGDHLPPATADCLRAGTGDDCVLGEIPPGGLVTVVVDTRFEGLPEGEDNYPDTVRLDLRAWADNEVNYFNNDQTVTYPTRIPVVEIEQVAREGDAINVRFRVLRPNAVPTDGVVLECADSLLGPWLPCTPPLPVNDDSRFIRPRGY